MMRLIISLILFTCACDTQAQVNYVLNPSFEQYSKCPQYLDQLKYALHWTPIDSIRNSDTLFYQPDCVPDYCNTCSPYCDTCYILGTVSVPINVSFYQYPRTGNGMVQVTMLIDPTLSPSSIDIRDYLQGKFYKPLIAGKNYCVTFYVNLEEASGYAIDKIGAYLDDGSIDVGQDSAGCGLPHPSIIPQVYTSAIITNDTGWTMIQGLITAGGTERFITIGNFFDDAHTDTLIYCDDPGNGFSAYLIDDVSVIEIGAKPDAGPDAYVSPGSDSATIGSSEEGLPLTWFVYGSLVPIGHTGSIKVHPDTTTTYVLSMDLCDGVTFDTVTVWVAPAGVTSPRPSPGERVTLSPNPARDRLTVSNAAGNYLVIYDVVGREVFTTTIVSDKQNINIKDFSDGVYLVEFVDSLTAYRVTKRLVIAQ